ncbi:EAL domain-containing protein [Rosenbergiella australiborealis]|uniref:EAL domain-containing protein n=1 Tax=Rosenbergiella australiborealis TaxID=1544696 RepID=A0ABS5T7E1_9GAMM|nr:EAL domain-containing protein [Rosenbergiella australiborealis]MBT0728294.1 EAL domain-containing protein [Rosenbergiella australiborealis]
MLNTLPSAISPPFSDDSSIDPCSAETHHAYKAMLNASIDGIKILTPDWRIENMNHAACLALGVDPKRGFGMAWLPLLPANTRRSARKALKKVAFEGKSEFFGKRVNELGETSYWYTLLTSELNTQGKLESILCVSRNITQQFLAESKLRHLTEFDELTNIPNRRHFQKYLKKTIRIAKVTQQSVTLLHADLDHFKRLNDIRGNHTGDHILKVVAKRLTKQLAGQGYVARLSSDEFAIVIPNTITVDEINQIAQDMVNTISQPISYHGQSIRLSMSIGTATWPGSVENSDMLMKAANIALTEIKQNRSGGVLQYHSQLMSSVTRIAEQLELAQYAIDHATIEPYYQPKVRLHDGKLVGVEALLRFIKPNGELASPGAIWAAFENRALVEKIGEQIRTRVFKDMQSWVAKGLMLVPVSLNASPVEFMWDDYAEKCLAQIADYGIDPRLIEIEITEHMIVGSGAEFVIRAIKQLREHGVRIALDDFGTGYSTLSNIKDYSVDVIKVDRSFVNSLDQGREGKAIIKALLLLANCLGMEVVAEGVEEQEQCDTLINEGYLIGQGFLFSPAVSNEKIEKLLGSRLTQR